MRIDVGEVIDARPVGRFQLLVVLLGALVAITDGVDLAAMGVAVPALAADWGVAPGSFGPALAASIVGVAFGSLLAGPLSDRYGRRPTLIAMTAVGGLATLSTAFVHDFSMLVATRFLTGVGAGATIPVALALTAEYVPARHRSLLVVLMFVGVPLGALSAGLLGPTLLEHGSWRSIFVLGGVVPLVVCALLAWKLPESLRFLVVRGGAPERCRALLARAAPDFPIPPDAVLATTEPPRSRTAIGELFGGGRAFATLVLWTVFAGTQFIIFLYTSWLPTLLRETGVPLSTALYVTATFQGGAVVGAIFCGWLSDRVRPDRVLAAMFVLAIVGVTGLALAQGQTVAIYAFAVLIGIGGPGAQVCLNAFAANLYPTHVRATGVGWALSVGRVGSIASPLLVGLALTLGFGPQQILLSSVVPAVICFLGILLAASRLKRWGGAGAGLAH